MCFRDHNCLILILESNKQTQTLKLYQQSANDLLKRISQLSHLFRSFGLYGCNNSYFFITVNPFRDILSFMIRNMQKGYFRFLHSFADKNRNWQGVCGLCTFANCSCALVAVSAIASTRFLLVQRERLQLRKVTPSLCPHFQKLRPWPHTLNAGIFSEAKIGPTESLLGHLVDVRHPCIHNLTPHGRGGAGASYQESNWRTMCRMQNSRL